MEKEVDNQYDEALRHSYRCIKAVLERQHPDSKMDELATGVTEYINEEAAQEGEEEPEPNATNEATFPPRSAPTDVTKANTPRARLVRSLMLPKLTTQSK